MTTTTSRRAVLAGAAAVLPASAIATAIHANGHTSRSREADHISVLAQRWRDVCRELEANGKRQDELSAIVEARCPPPECLRARPSDLEMGFEPPVVKRMFYLAPADMLQFRGKRRTPIVVNTPERILVDTNGAPWPADKCARADEIVAAFEPWRANQDELSEQLGESELEEHGDAIFDRAKGLEQEIAAASATTIEAIAAKAKFVIEIQDHYADFDPELTDQVMQQLADMSVQS